MGEAGSSRDFIGPAGITSMIRWWVIFPTAPAVAGAPPAFLDFLRVRFALSFVLLWFIRPGGAKSAGDVLCPGLPALRRFLYPGEHAVCRPDPGTDRKL